MRLGLGLSKYKNSVGGLVTPIDIGGLKAWYTFEASTVEDTAAGSISDGEEVGLVLDKSSNGFDLGQHPITLENRPLWVENAIAGEPGVEFDGTARRLYNDDALFTVSQPNTVIIVGKVDSVNNMYFYGAALGINNFGTRGNGAYRLYNGTVLEGGSVDTNYHYYTCITNGVSSIVRKDGVQIFSGNSGVLSRDGLVLGGDSGGAIFRLDGTIAEFVIWDGILAGDDLTNAEAYVASKYGL